MYTKSRTGIAATAAAVVFALAASLAYAQDVDRTPRQGDDEARPSQEGDRGDREGRRGPGGRFGGGDFDPEEFRARMMERLQERLGSTDEEWAAVSPLIGKVMEAQNDLRPYEGGVGFFFGGGRGGRGFGGPGGGSDDAPERDALQRTVDSGGDIEGKLKAYREAREAKQEALKQAQADLKAVLTVKQEGMLVLMGMLE